MTLKSNPIVALEQLKNLCENYNLARACSNYAFQFEDPKFSSQTDLKKAYEYYLKACDLHDGIGRNNLANLLIEGRGVVIDKMRSIGFLQKSCDFDYAPGCYRIAIIISRGILLKNDIKKVGELMDKGCRLGDIISCHDLDYLYLEGKGVERDLLHAFSLFSRACDDSLARGCGTLGSLYISGGAEQIDYTKAFTLLQRACAGDDGPSCSNLGALLEEGKGIESNPKEAAQYYIKGCNAGDDYKTVNETWALGEKNQLSFSNAQSNYRIVETIDKSSDPLVKKVQLVIESAGQVSNLDCRYPIFGSLNSEPIKAASNRIRDK